MDDAAPRGHQVDRAGLDPLEGAEAVAVVDRAVELGAGDARRVGLAYLIAAEAALLLGEDDRAHDMARRAVAELPSNARAHATLAAIDALTGRDDPARLAMAASSVALEAISTAVTFESTARTEVRTFTSSACSSCSSWALRERRVDWAVR